ncbi:MAG: ribosome maturation factor RimM, partial [Actinomycetota bacterium]
GRRLVVLVHLSTNREERVEVGTVLRHQGGTLEVARSQPYKKAHLVHFAGVSSRDRAESLRGVVLWADPIVDPDVTWAHEVIGATVVDQHGVEHGRVVAMEANPASDLLVLEGEELVPVRFVVEVRPGERVDVDVPDGLL